MPGIRLEITVDDKGTPVVRQFNQEVSKAPGMVQQTERSFSTSAASALRFAGALTGVQLGISAVSQSIQAAGRAIVNFEAGLANINTLGIRSTDTQQRLRAELLQLPAVLGTSTELATGLYEVLSSGIAPTQAVRFLGEAAMLAQAGLAQLDTSTVALTKTMAAYNLPAEQAGRVSDILFKTVEIGQGSLQQFAGALPQVTQLAASMGVSLEDTANAMATLSQTFRNADTAATGFRSLLQQLLQNSDQFLALGINIRQVIGEQGLVGAVRVLQQVSQGSSERLRTFVNDIEGFNAALALTGPQFNTLIQNQQKFQQASGSVAEALRQQSMTTAAAWREFVGTVDRTLQAFGPTVTSVLTSILKTGTQFVTDFNMQVLLIPKAVQQAKQDLDRTAPAFAQTVRELLAVPAGAPLAQELDKQHAALVRQREALLNTSFAQQNLTALQAKATEELAKAFAEQDRYTAGTLSRADAERLAAESVARINTTLQAFDAALGEVNKRQALTTEQVKVYATTLENSLRAAAASGLVSTATLQKGASDAADAIRDRLGQLTPELRKIVDAIENAGKAAPIGLGPITRVLKEVDDQGRITLRTIRAFGEEGVRAFKAAEAAVPRVTQVIKEVDAQGRTTLRTIEVFGPATEAAFAKRGKAAVAVFSEEVNKATDAITQALIESGNQAGGFARRLTEAQLKSAFELGLISRQAYETALALKQAGAEGGQGFAEGVTAGTEEARGRLRQVADDARAVSIVFRQAFGDTPRQLFEQLRDQRTRLANANQIAAAAGLTEPGNFEAYRKQIIDSANDAIYLITERLRDLGYNADGTRIMLDTLAESTTQLEQATSMLATTTTEAGTALQQQATGPVQSLGAGYVMAAMGAQALIDRQRELLALAGGSQVTDAPGRNRPVGSSVGGPGGSSLLGGPPLLVPTGGSLTGGLSPADLGLSLTRPTQPGSLSLPVRVPVAPTLERSPLLPGFPGGVTTTAPTSAAATGGGPTLTGNEQTFQGGQGGPGRGGNIVDRVPTIGGGSTRSINVTVNTMALTRGAAQDLAQNLAPALRELQRRGEI